ncbi:MAG: type II/IV secretion system protein [Desulfobacteraceae bacterium]|uniref:Type II/IV secretion system protein n=1 Tax=Candidatus Desulfacyla euxinica TaxID=2841693 RepID=A0A8J6N4A3_9DELT|nr:type II/IV secretion system protein [Candidatus Desulfacyla euxinica]MBL6979414.1 type II/IV secretion system protein [Desulfobacteraceae bacterium]
MGLSKLTPASRYDYLLNKGLATPEQLQKALSVSKSTKKSVELILTQQFKLKKADIGKSLSLFYGCPFKEFDPKAPVPIELITNLKKTFLLHDLWVPLSWRKDGVDILIDDPWDLRKTGLISGLTKTRKINFCVGIKEDIEKFISLFFEKKTEKATQAMIAELDMIPDISFEEEEEEEDLEMSEETDEPSSQVVRLVDQVIVAALRKNASDIHVEPSPITHKTTIRFRLDGVCQEYMQVPNSLTRGVLSRLKIMAGIDIAERRLPQDGKIKFRRRGIPPLDLRLATLPTAGGHEDAVMRLLVASGALKLDEMGLSERNLRVMKRILVQPYGLILAVGPTGSGKTTTLHSALGYINKPGVKIWTAEDPVEITQPGLRQVEVKPKIGLDFAKVMRSFLRADPDVIMIGEMRDNETASIGIEASLTGHLVLSTLHTNSASETITRLLDMGLNPLNFSDALLGVLAQRLIRKLCSNCRKKYHPSLEEFEALAAEYGKEAFQSANIEYSPKLVLYRPSGCDACSGTGYRGRMGIHELLEGTPEIKRLIKKEGVVEELFAQGVKDGMTTLKQDGIDKVFSGLTDISEVRRVCID